MRITYSKIAYVECGATILDAITQNIGGIAEGDGQTVVNYDSLLEWLSDESNKDNEKLYNPMIEVSSTINTEIESTGDQVGEVIFSC